MSTVLHKILVLASIVLAAALLTSYSAQYISPDIFWPPAFFALAYPYLLVANALLIIYWILRRRISFLIPLLAILMGYSYIGRFIQLGNTPPTSQPERSISLLSYNTRSFDRYQWTKDPETPKKIVSLIAQQRNAIICLQEFRSTSKGVLTLSNQKKKFKTPYTHISKKTNGVATFSRYPILKRGEIPFGKPHLCNCIFSDLKIGKDTIRVYNIHLESNRLVKHNYKFINQEVEHSKEENLEEIKDISLRLRSAFSRRAQQVDIIRKHINKSPYPSIICGDLNDTPHSYAYRKLKGDYKDAFQKWGRGVGTTYIGEFPSFRIDFLFYDPSITCKGYDRIKKKYSDHYPIYGYFSL